MDSRGLAFHFAHWACKLTSVDVPESVHAIAHRAMLDTLAVTVAGATHPDIGRLATIWQGAGGRCGLSTGGYASAETAALINGSAAHFWDFDDTSYTGIMHGSAVVFPVVVVLAQELAASDEDALTAFIIGSEVAYVLADICSDQHYFDGWWSTTTLGLVGATAAAAWLMGCTEDQTAQAIGLAGATAGGGKSVFGTNAKSFLVGETAQRAIKFARFAKAGMTGPATSFHGENGFFHLLNNDVEQQDEIETLGVRWRLANPGLLVKRYPVCSAAHAAIDEVARHTFDAGLSPDDIEIIHLEIPKLVRISLMHDAPATPSEAQFSLPFAAACAALHGSVRLADLNSETIQAPVIKTLMQRVQISVAEDLSTTEIRERYPESARVRIVLNNGEERTGFCGEAYGMPGRPLSDADFIRKFRECLTFAGCLADVKNIFDNSILRLTADLFGAHQTTKTQQRRLS